uniref:Uncharacterized protein n=1 Tax=Anguilla anguilla TaxID=7936 RepID=A0A0E9Q033_ANGAN
MSGDELGEHLMYSLSWTCRCPMDQQGSLESDETPIPP